MDLTLIVERLRERLDALQLREVEQAAGLDAAMRGNVATPSVYVVPLSERGLELRHTGATDQLETRLFGVLQVTDTLERTGAPDLATFAPLRAAIKRALVGWVPDAVTGEPVIFLGGELIQLEGDGRLWWSDEFVFTGYFRSISP